MTRRGSGCGTPGRASRSSDQARIFDRFTRGPGRSRRYRGGGLGLAIVRAIAEAHGGRVELDSRLGEGSTFTIVIPRAETAREPRWPRILIAEDDPLIGSFLEKGLRASGFATLVVDDGEEAERLALTDEFDLLILDMGLPEREGFHVLQDAPLAREAAAGDRAHRPPRARRRRLPRGRRRRLHAQAVPLRRAARARTRPGCERGGTEARDVLRAGDVRLDLRTRRATSAAGRSS